MSRTVFESLAWLFAPADAPDAATLVEARADWRLRLPAGPTSIVWGRMPARPGPVGSALRAAVARERSLRAVRSGGNRLRTWDVHRIPPVARRSGWRGALRSAVLSGAVVRFGSGEVRPRVADEIAALAGHVGPRVRLRASGDGSAMARIERPGKPTGLLRLAAVGGLKDAGRQRQALDRLGAAGVEHVPRLLAGGTALDVGWSVEEVLAGQLVRQPSAELIAEVVTWAASLPRSGTSAVAAEERLELVARSFPEWAPDLQPVLARVRAVARDVPGVLEHGDLWAGNLLAADGRLTGVVDWDNWHAAGVPGSDLLHLVTMAGRARGRELGELWLDRPWAAREFAIVTAPYWQGLGVPLTDDLAWLLGVNWWVAHVAAGLRRGRQPAGDPEWVARNVGNVAPVLAAMG